MNTTKAQYLNELASLTVLALMVVALIAAQAGAAVPGFAERSDEAPRDTAVSLAEIR